MTITEKDPAALIQAVDTAVTRVRTRTLDVSFNELFDMYKSKELIIAPDFQRLFRWSEVKQSQFIESLILELPIPPIYVVEVQDGVYELIDGLQRISSYFHFRRLHTQKQDAEEDALVLEGCDVLPDVNGLTYDKLPQALQIKLKRHFIRMEVLRRETDPHLRYHMFKRLNTGGELLSPQELRNCTIRLLDNKFNDLLKELSKNPDYLACMEQLTEEKREQMYLEEFVLRFFALKNNQSGYVKDIGDFLTEYMEAVSDPDRHDMPFDFDAERTVFGKTFKILHDVLGTGAFSGFNERGTAMGYFSALHFEAFALGIQKQLDRLAADGVAGSDKVKQAFIATKTDAEFKKLTTGGGKNYAAAFRQRVEFIEKRVAACLK